MWPPSLAWRYFRQADICPIVQVYLHSHFSDVLHSNALKIHGSDSIIIRSIAARLAAKAVLFLITVRPLSCDHTSGTSVRCTLDPRQLLSNMQSWPYILSSVSVGKMTTIPSHSELLIERFPWLPECRLSLQGQTICPDHNGEGVPSKSDDYDSSSSGVLGLRSASASCVPKVPACCNALRNCLNFDRLSFITLPL